jgi:spore germination protein YaaH
MSARGIQRAGLLAAMLLLLLAAPAAHGASGGVQAFLLASAPDSFTDLQAHARSIETVYPTYYECEPGGAIAGHDEPVIDAYARGHHIPLLPRFSCQDGPTVHAILTGPALRARTLAALSALARNSSFAGLSLDLENDGALDREALTSFVSQLASELHAAGRRLTVVVDGVTHEDPRRSTGFYNDNALAAVADNVFVLAWGSHWAGSDSGPLAPLPWVRQVAAYFASLPNHTRFVLAAPMYGLDWEQASGGMAVAPAGPAGSANASLATADQYAGVVALAHATGAKPLRDRSVDELTFAYTRAGVTHRVWYMDARAIRDRLAAGRDRGLKVGVWRLGGEDQGLWASRFAF